jgi:hypothetical protein
VPQGAGSFADFISFGVYKRLGPAAELPAREAFLDGLNEILLWAGLLAIAGAVLSLLLVRARDVVAHHAPASAAPHVT